MIKPWALYLTLSGGLFVLSFFIPISNAIVPTHTLADPAHAVLDIINGMTKLMVSLNTAMLGAAATLTVKGANWTSTWGTIESTLIVVVFICGATSYFGTYFCNVRLLTMVNAAAINPLETGLLWSLRLQFYGTLAGVFLLGLLFSRIIEGRLRAPNGKL